MAKLAEAAGAGARAALSPWALAELAARRGGAAHVDEALGLLASELPPSSNDVGKGVADGSSPGRGKTNGKDKHGKGKGKGRGDETAEETPVAVARRISAAERNPMEAVNARRRAGQLPLRLQWRQMPAALRRAALAVSLARVVRRRASSGTTPLPGQPSDGSGNGGGENDDPEAIARRQSLG